VTYLNVNVIAYVTVTVTTIQFNILVNFWLAGSEIWLIQHCKLNCDHNFLHNGILLLSSAFAPQLLSVAAH